MKSITRQAIINEVERRGWIYETLLADGDGVFIVTDDKGRSSIARGARFANSSGNGIHICKLKNLSYVFLESLGYTVPEYHVVKDSESANDFLRQYSKVVVKPIDAEQSRGVSVNITNEGELSRAINLAESASYTGKVVLQRQVDGKLYRLLVVNNSLFAAAYRRAAFVVGDGASTVRQLIEQKNLDPQRSEKDATPLKKIKIDDALHHLGVSGLEKILPLGEELEVVAIASISAGGEAEDVTDKVHPFYKQAAEHITSSLGLGIAGIDIITDDITTPEEQDDYFPIIEINSLPGFKLHLYPTAGGIPRNPSAAVLDAAFPQ
jgi:cyanophycin synthetase